MVVDHRRELLVAGVAILAHRVLQFRYRFRVLHMILAANAVLVISAHIELRIVIGKRREEGEVVLHLGFLSQHIQPDAAEARRRPGKVTRHHLLVEPDRLKDLGAAVALQGRDTHLREDLQQTLAD